LHKTWGFLSISGFELTYTKVDAVTKHARVTVAAVATVLELARGVLVAQLVLRVPHVVLLTRGHAVTARLVYVRSNLQSCA